VQEQVRSFYVVRCQEGLSNFQYLYNADAPKLEADPESKMGRKLPQWLSTLIEKHQTSVGVVLKSTPAPTGIVSSNRAPLAVDLPLK